MVEALKNLDTKLVAFLSGAEEEVTMSTKKVEQKQQLSQLSQHLEEREMLQLFEQISAIKLEMEALALQPEGTKRMELLQSDIRPIFTVECQLSHELIKEVPRSDTFHIMQFESEKFQSQTQCTRFGQEAQRDVRLSRGSLASAKAIDNLNLGRIHFTVWWREPGTSLNEMLGLGVLELVELYNASLLEQCKCITINRRGIHLASLYFKLSLVTDGAQAKTANTVSQQEEQGELAQNSGKPTTTDKANNNFFFPQDTKVQ